MEYFSYLIVHFFVSINPVYMKLYCYLLVLKTYGYELCCTVNWVLMVYRLSKSGDHSLSEYGAVKTWHLLHKYLEVSSRSVGLAS